MTLALCFPNRFDTSALSGQGWVSTLPLSNLRAVQLSQVARAQQPIARLFINKASLTARLVGLAAHNMSTAGRVRVRAWNSDPRTPLDATSKVAVLDLPFVDWTGIPSGFTFTSAAGYYWGADGLLKYATANQPRITHDRTTGTPLGLLLEGVTENRAIWCRDGTQSAWTKSANMGAPSLAATGIDGTANSATRLTAVGPNAMISQTVSGSGTLRAGVWLRRVSGSSAISITGNSFVGSTPVAISSTWQWFSESFTSGMQFGVLIAGAGDVIEMDFAYVGQFASTGPGPTPIYTTGSTASRAGDTLSYSIPTALQSSALNGGAVWRGYVLTPRSVSSPNDTSLFTVGGATQFYGYLANSFGNATAIESHGANTFRGNQPALGTRIAIGCGWAASNNHYGAQNGALMTPISSPATVSGAFTTLTLTPSSYSSVVQERFSLFSTALDGTDVTTLSNATATEPTPAYDSGWLDAWPSAWVSATTTEQRAGARGVAVADLGGDRTHQWWRIDLSDPSNSSGFVQLGRVFMGSMWKPTNGMATGASLGYESRSTTTEADDGAEYHTERRGPRVAQFRLEAQTQSDAMFNVLEMQRQLGATGELLFMWDSTDTTYQPLRTFMGRLRTLSPLTAINSNLWSCGIEVKERL